MKDKYRRALSMNLRVNGISYRKSTQNARSQGQRLPPSQDSNLGSKSQIDAASGGSSFQKRTQRGPKARVGKTEDISVRVVET